MNINRPFFSIIIPTYSRPVQLLNCVEALTKLVPTQKGFEVIIVDDGSPQYIKSTLEEFKNKLKITYLKQANTGPAAARNRGAKQAKGSYLIFIDDDCRMQPNYLVRIEKLIQIRSEEIFAGKTINALPKNIFSGASQLLTDFLNSFFKDKSQNTTFLVSNNFVINKKLFINVGGFDTKFKGAGSEDREFGLRLVHNGHKICYAPNLLVDHAHQMNFKQFWKQHFTYGKGTLYFRQISKINKYPVQKIPAIPFYLSMLFFPFKMGFKWKGVSYSVLIIISQIAYITGYLNEKWNP